MRLVKVEDGLLEHTNYFLNAPIGDFLGDFLCSRTADTFILRSGYVERKFPYNEYVIVVERDSIPLDEGEVFKFYTRKGSQVAGLVEKKEDEFDITTSATHWKLIRHGGFIQGYASYDNGETWINKGGGEAIQSDIQGFSIEGSQQLKIKDYRVYRSPYVRFYNFEKGTTAIAYDSLGREVIRRVADEDDLIEIYLENPIVLRIAFYDKNNQLITETPLMEFKYGDTFFMYPYDIEFYYKGLVLDYKPTKLHTRHEMVEMKNLSPTQTYKNLKLTIVHNTVDTIRISLNNIDFYEELIVPSIAPNQVIPIYIKIDKNPNYPSYGIRKFALEVDDGTGFLGGTSLASVEVL